MVASPTGRSPLLSHLRRLFLLACSLWAVYAGAVTALPPVITGFSPTSASPGTTVTLTGRHFTEATGVYMHLWAAHTGAAPYDGVPFTVVNDAVITFTVPQMLLSHTYVGDPVTVFTPAGMASSAKPFTYLPNPTFTPGCGATGTTVTLTGDGFTGAMAVTFNGVRAKSFSVQNATTIRATVPAGATSGLITVSGLGWSATSTTLFTVLAAPAGWQEAQMRWHQSAFFGVSAYAPAQSLIAVVQGFMEVALYQTDGTLVRTLSTGQPGIQSLAFSPDGQTLVSCNSVTSYTGMTVGTIKCWRVSDGACLRTLTGFTGITQAVFSPDGETLAVVCYTGNRGGQGLISSNIRLLRVSDGACLRTFADCYDIAAVAFSPDGQMLLSGGRAYSSASATVWRWRVSDGTLQFTYHAWYGGVNTVAFSPDGQWVVAGGYVEGVNGQRDGNVACWPVNTFAPLYICALPYNPVDSLAFSPDGQTLASGGDMGSINFWRVSDGALQQTINGYGLSITMLAFSVDGQQLISDSTDGTLSCLQVSDGTLLHLMTGQGASINAMACAPDGQTLLTSNWLTVQSWNMDDGTGLHATDYQGVVRALSPDGQWFATNIEMLDSDTFSEVIKILRTSDGANVCTIPNVPGSVMALAFSPDGQMLAATIMDAGGTSDALKIWRISDGACVRTFSWSSSQPYLAIAWSPDGTTVATIGNEIGTDGWFGGVVRCWRVTDGTALPAMTLTRNALYTLAFAPEGDMLATAGIDDTQGIPRGTIQYWRTTDGTCLRTLAAHDYGVWGLAFSPDGQTLASSGLDGTTRLWRVRDGACLQQLTGYSSLVTNLLFTPDGRHLATCGQDGLAVWEVTVPALASFTPAGGPAGTAVTLFGQDLAGATAVTFNGKAASFTVVDDTTLTALVPPGATSGRIAVRTPNGDVASLDAFQALKTPPISVVTLTAWPASAQPVNTAITLTAGCKGGGVVEYKFRACAGGVWSDLTDYTTTATCVWQPSQYAKYTLAVWVRTVGNSAKKYEGSKSISFTVTPPPLTGVTLSASTVAPQPVKTPITLIATPVGGGKVEYKFRAGYADARGWHWKDLTGYTTKATYRWTPTLVADYTLEVWAREAGTGMPYTVRGMLGYTIR